MKSLILLGLVLVACNPQIVSYNQTQMEKKRGNIITADLKTGERFTFAEPGAGVVRMYNMIFGRTDLYEYVVIPLSAVDSIYGDGPLRISDVDSLTVLRRLTTKTYVPYQFDKSGARLYRTQSFIVGTTLNGETVKLPIDRVEGGQKLLNYENVKAGRAVQTLFAAVGIIGLVSLRMMMEENAGK